MNNAPTPDAAVLLFFGGSAVLAFFGWLARWAWVQTHKRIDETLRLIRDHDSEDRRRHEEIIRATERLKTQMERFVSDMTSEKRTRAEVNKEIFAKLDRIQERLPERRDV